MGLDRGGTKYIQPTKIYSIKIIPLLQVEENEAVINSVLSKRDVKLVPTGLQDIGDKGIVNFKGKR